MVMQGFFVNQAGVKSSDLKPKRAKTQPDEEEIVVKPKPACSAYKYFQKEQSAVIMRNEKISIGECNNILSGMWKNISIKSRAKYEK